MTKQKVFNMIISVLFGVENIAGKGEKAEIYSLKYLQQTIYQTTGFLPAPN